MMRKSGYDLEARSVRVMWPREVIPLTRVRWFEVVRVDEL